MKILEKLIGGTNCTIFKFCENGKYYVSKHYDIQDTSIIMPLITNHLEIRNTLKVYGIKIPTLRKVILENGLDIVEDYVGESVRSLFRKDKKNIGEIITSCIDIIKKLPQDIPLDINPGNFTVHTDGFIYFVDFMPPNPWQFEKQPQQRLIFENIFPTTRLIRIDKEMRKRYYLNSYRTTKFLYYLDI